jgi:hypothetical protein
MFRFELGVAATVFHLTAERRARFSPSHVDEFGEVIHENGLFNVMKPEDVIDRYTIDADAFLALVSWLCCDG